MHGLRLSIILRVVIKSYLKLSIMCTIHIHVDTSCQEATSEDVSSNISGNEVPRSTEVHTS